MSKVVLIAGASGVVGSAAVDRFLESRDWSVIAVSRRRPITTSTRPFRHVPFDLRDRTACGRAVGALRGITHVVYAALFEKPGLVAGWTEPDQMSTNLAMFQNLLDPVVATQPIRHVSLLQGTKAYGAHLHPIPIPARERQPRDNHPNFYWLQEDDLRERAARPSAGGGGWDWTIFRPQLIVGGAVGVAMNLVPVLGAYAAICREDGLGFGYPGGASYVWEAVDARLVARALEWATGAAEARNEIFNVTNGDVFEWRNLWPEIAEATGAEPGPDRPRRLATFLPEHAATWERVVRRYGLRKLTLHELLGESHHYADRCFAAGEDRPRPPMFLSTIKLRQAGFADCMDTADTFRYWLATLAERRFLPPPLTGH